MSSIQPTPLTVVVTTRLDPTLAAKLRAQALVSDRSISQEARVMIRSALTGQLAQPVALPLSATQPAVA